MDGDPLDPVPLIPAIRELASLWETDAHSGEETGPDNVEPAKALIWEMSKAQLVRHFGSVSDAALHLFRHAIMSRKIRVWVMDGPDWKRPTIHTILATLQSSSGSTLTVDRLEVKQVFNGQWPGTYPDRNARVDNGGSEEPDGKESVVKARKRPGPPKGDGFSRKDVPIYENILKAQRESGDVETQYTLVRKFAGPVNSPYFKANVERLRKGLPKWLVKNGHEWIRSN